MSKRLNEGDEVQVKVELADDGSGHTLFPDFEPRPGIVYTPKRDAYLSSGHIVMIPLNQSELDNWHEGQKHDVDGRACVKLTNVKEQHLA